MGIEDRLEKTNGSLIAITLSESEMTELRNSLPLQSWLAARNAAVAFAATIPGIRLLYDGVAIRGPAIPPFGLELLRTVIDRAASQAAAREADRKLQLRGDDAA